MSENENYGVILRTIRRMEGLSVQKFAQKIHRSNGWLSEVENGMGKSRLQPAEFERIICGLGYLEKKHQFKSWVANHQRQAKTNRMYEGAIFRFVRTKKKLSLTEVSVKSGIPRSIVSKIENGSKDVSLEIRNRLLRACGYSPESYKNFSNGSKRSKAVPDSFKLKILLNRLNQEQISQLFRCAEKIYEGQSV